MRSRSDILTTNFIVPSYVTTSLVEHGGYMFADKTSKKKKKN